MVHRDLKPDNIMLVRAGRPRAEYEQVKLIDFGLVKLLGEAADDVGGGKLTATGTTFGSPAYMAPEQALGRAVDGRADLYALGIVLFEMLTGRRPFDGADPNQVARLQVVGEVPRVPPTESAPWATPEVATLVETALQKSPEARFPSAAAMIEALDAAFLSIDHLPH
jgi:serine/threonine-protein kinase